MMSDITESISYSIDAGDFKDKRLLVITPNYPNKDGSYFGNLFVKNQIDVMKSYFKEVIVIVPHLFSASLLLDDRLCHNYTYSNVRVFYQRSFYIPWPVYSKLNLRWIYLDTRASAVEALIQKEKITFDLVHAHFTWPSGYVGVRLKEKFGKPVITTIHENGDWFDQEVGMNHPLINAAWSDADALIRVNKKDVPVLQRYNEQVYAIPNGFSPGFRPIDTCIAREQLGLREDGKIIFTLGNLIKRKGFNYLIDAMEQVFIQRDDVICYIGGRGPERDYLQKQIDRLNLGEKVKLLGPLPGDQLTLWMNACDFFVLPSLNEGNPTVMFEALGFGKAYVGTTVGGVPEIITSDKYGMLVKPADTKDLAEKILLALDREWDREAILTYAEQFTWENVVKKIMEIYRAVDGS